MYSREMTVIVVHGDTDRETRQKYLDTQVALKKELNHPPLEDHETEAKCAVTVILHGENEDRCELLLNDWELVRGLKAGDRVKVSVSRD